MIILGLGACAVHPPFGSPAARKGNGRDRAYFLAPGLGKSSDALTAPCWNTADSRSFPDFTVAFKR